MKARRRPSLLMLAVSVAMAAAVAVVLLPACADSGADGATSSALPAAFASLADAPPEVAGQTPSAPSSAAARTRGSTPDETGRLPAAGPDQAMSTPGTPLPSPGSGTGGADSLRGKVIVLDPGHNGGNARHPAEVNQLVDVITHRKVCDTVGSQTAAGYAEWDFNLDVSRRMAALLEADGMRVVLTRTDSNGWGPCITERAAIGNRAGTALALSIHADGGPYSGRGFHVIEPGLVPGHNDGIIAPSGRLGAAIREAYADGTGIPYADYIGTAGRSVRTDLGGLNLSRVPKVFVECGNLRNPTDAALLSDPDFRQRIARAVVDGIERYLRAG